MRKPCCDKEGTNKGAWSKQEDQKLIDYIRTHGEGCWRSLPKAAGLHRCGKSCRLRWINYLRPDIKRGNFGQDEEDLIIKLHALLGNRWSLIAGRLPGRTDNEVKNYWNSHVRKKLMRMGIDPNNHKLNSIKLQVTTQTEQVSTADKSSGSINTNDACKKPLKLLGENNERAASDAASSNLIEDLETSCSSDLNLDLTIAFPSPDSLQYVEEKPQEKSYSCLAKEMEISNNTFPTLILFR
ncbi:hypothetical protein UlMin_023973 [Ulmus minor]